MTELFPQGIRPIEVAFAVAAAGGIIDYVAFILGPAWSSYGRLWERLAAAVLSVYILVTLIGIGLAIGAGIVLSYDSWVEP